VLQLVQGQEEQRIQQLQDLHQERHLRGEQVAFPLKLPCPQDLAHALAAAAPDCPYYRGMAVREPMHRVVSFYLFLWHHVFLLCFCQTRVSMAAVAVQVCPPQEFPSVQGEKQHPI
jgi:hypothetical protein